MQITHDGVTYDCSVAVKCENDKYIKLYDESGAEIFSFEGISDFSKYEIVGGSFIAPCDCPMPIHLSLYVIGGRTIKITDWNKDAANGYKYTISNDLISENEVTCDILLIFAPGTVLEYTAKQEKGKLVIYTSEVPANDIIINSIHISRA